MPFRTGFCASGTHDKCLFVAVNGSKAYDRYVGCTCSCHEGSTRAVNLLLERAPGPVAAPVQATADEFARYIDTLNALLRPSGGDGEESPVGVSYDDGS